MQLLLMLLLLSVTVIKAQIVISGSVYGGGNEGNVGGSTSVTVRAGDINKVYGGARMANIAKNAFVNIDGENASNYILINYVYGGNDIAGTIGTNLMTFNVPNVLSRTAENKIDGSWNAFVRISTKTTTTGEAPNTTVEEANDAQKIYIGQLFGGSNGEYYYQEESGIHKIYDYNDHTKLIASNTTGFIEPNLKKTYLEILGGSIVYAYGGGNNATITDKTVICLDNPSNVVNDIIDTSNPNANTDPEKGKIGELLTNDRFENKMGINTTLSYPESDAFQIGRLFGGNNMADMAIRPRWNLQRGKVRDLYSGGNEGRMTSPEGLLLQVEGAGMKVDNVYGGCRKADVRPLYDNDDDRPVAYEDIQLDPADNPNGIPDGYAARVRILDGDVNNVYGGNDISGNVYGGNTVGILTSIRGNVYGGGNGSYAYTDNDLLKDTPRWHDLYYNPDHVLEKAGVTVDDEDLKSAEALNIFRPNAEKVSILVRGTETKPVVIKGDLYVGGNSASLREHNSSGSSSTNSTESATHLKIGSYVTIGKVFLGNNGENMIKYNDVEEASLRGEGVLKTFARNDLTTDGSKFNSMVLTTPKVFEKYMEGCAMKVKPNVLFESKSRKDPYDYIPYSTYIGSFYCGGNVGSILVPGKMTVDFTHEVVIYEKLVGGCNNAKVVETTYNAEYLGGLIGDPETPVSPQTIGDKLVLNLSGLKIEPKRWNNDGTALEWNTYIGNEKCPPITSGSGTSENPIHADNDDMDRRLVGGNIYGGCDESGIVNGNVVINVNASIINRNDLFDEVKTNADDGEESLYQNNVLGYGKQHYHILKRHTGVILGQQGMDVFGMALNLFGGGKGAGTEIWGSTTINLNKGYVFQVFGGSEEGVIGQSGANGALTYNSAYSCYVNLKGSSPGVSKVNAYNINMPECEFIYGGGFEGPIAGNTVVSLGNGRIFNSFAGSCDADIYGHTETYIGYRHDVEDEKGVVTGQVDGFPYIRDMVYGGNDLGGAIKNSEPKDFSDRLRIYDANVTDDPNNFDVSGKVHKKTEAAASNPNVLKASAYVEYNQGRAAAVFGGHFGTYDYISNDSEYKRDLAKKPYLDNTFVNFRPTSSDILKNPEKKNTVDFVYGGSQGYPGDFDSNRMQDRSYVLIDIPEDMDNYKTMQVFGAGAWGGMGMKGDVVASNVAEVNLDKKSAIIDLVRGKIDAAYGGSYHTGFTRRTVVNVPTGSKIQVNNLFGGAFGESLSSRCDVYEANVNYKSADAIVKQAIYGGNNAYRRTLYGRVNIDTPVKTGELDNNNESKLAVVYGAGYGANTWSQYTEVNLNGGAKVAEVYGGGQAGRVMNIASVAKWAPIATQEILTKFNTEHDAWEALSEDKKKETPEPVYPGDVSLDLGGAYTDLGLADPLVKSNPLGVAEDSWKTDKFNTNVYINAGAVVDVSLVTKSYGPGYDGGYAYAGGLGYSDVDGSGDVYGTTYVGLFGGEVKKDIYAGGTVGSVMNRYEPKSETSFTAKTYAYIEGGTVRNVYGGGWQGSVGKHQGETVTVDGKAKFLPIAGSTDNDILGESTVVIGIRKDLRDAQKPKPEGLPATLTYTKGVPAIQRNAYSGGEGGAVFGTANLIINNGYIGYYYDATDSKYKEKLHDETWSDGVGENRLEDCGNAFGGGYDDLSSVDYTDVKMYGGVIRNSLHGGGEIATIGRGTTKQSSGVVRELDQVFKDGKTHIEMYNGHVLRNVFGGGKGYNKLKYGVGNELYTDGYVFGQTEVYIHGGEIGTVEGIAKEYGNVFGGGDIGYVYSSAYAHSKSLNESTGSPGHITYKKNDGSLTEDCKVVVSPYLQVKPGETTVLYNNKTYQAYDYVPTDYLNTLGKKTSVTSTGAKDWPDEWKQLITEEGEGENQVDRGVIIHNAVFGGGNVSTSSDKTYANATTVFGNVTATLNDVYHRDFISIGTEHIGGLYGGGNFSMVDGYRELNITNYGTDYFSLDQQIDLDTYRGLSNRERAYFKLKYECKADITFTKEGVDNSRPYTAGEKIDEDVYLRLLDRYGSQVESAFTPWGICSIYAGRLLNTIQRADFCGVFGSRMVLQGAKDRVADTEQNTDYTINRVTELSLNKKRSVISSDTGNDAEHGNYFGIYSVVNYLGNMTSDQHFDDFYEGSAMNTTVTPNQPYQGDGATTYYSYKAGNPTSGKRNLAECPHQVALASGVHLELTTENSTEDHKDYGYITGVVELDLINVKKDKVMGGGFVYARNEHRVPKYFPKKENVLLSEYNQKDGDEAITYKRFFYASADIPEGTDATGAKVISGNDADFGDGYKSWQTSGNFIHPEKHIVDDCYPTNNAYDPEKSPYSEAHYWYVKGEVYVYDQIVTAYTGSASAYQKESQLNLTITAASNGKLQLLNVKPNLYAYKMPTSSTDATPVKIGTVNDGDGNPIDQVTVNNEHDTYKLNDVITWWDWHQLNADERAYFVTNTYVNCVTIKVGDQVYEPGTYVLDETDKTTAKAQFENGTLIIKDAEGNTIKKADGETDADFNYIFRSSNNISHDEGYVLTFDMTTPTVWSKYYTAKERSATQTDQSDDSNDLSAPTYYPTTGGVYGTHNYVVGEIITKATVDAYTAGFGDKVKPAYVAVNKVTYTSGTSTATANEGSAISATVFNEITNAEEKANFEPAYVCISTVKLADGVYLGKGDLKSASQIEALKTKYAETKTIENGVEQTIVNQKLKDEIDAAMKEAYICVESGQFGGQQFSNTQNYDVIDAWCALSKTDRTNGGFTFNQDALDLLADHDYVTVHDNADIQYPLETRTQQAYGSTYSSRVPIEYDAICDVNSFESTNGQTYSKNDKINQDVYEALPNDQCHYTRVELEEGVTKAYIVLDNFTYYGVPYGKGQVIEDYDTYFDIHSDPNYTAKVTEKDFGSSGTHYYCYEDYSSEYSSGSLGNVINEEAYDVLKNEQKNFIIQGKEPVETSTLYVSSESDIFDVSKERVYTVVYQYTYYENEDRNNVKFTNELHVINVHVQMESGVPVIGPLTPPDIVIPGNAVSMNTPDVTVGSYPPLGNGWEIYSSEQDAKLHRNGEEYENGVDPLYWYQNGDYYINYYSRNYLGKMYAPKPMPLKVANYHDLDAVMKDNEHHMYVDHPKVKRSSKIYIDDRACKSDATKSELDLLKDFFDLSVVKNPTLDDDGKITSNDNTALNGHTPLDDHVHGARNLEFILRSDVSPKAYTEWTPIGSNGNNITDNPTTSAKDEAVPKDDPDTAEDESVPYGQCFEGNLHGDGYTVSGLTNSLFAHFCGEAYNLGVTGSFTSSGIADEGTGYLENCWVKSSNNTDAKNVKAVFGTPTNDNWLGARTMHMVNCYYPEENQYTAHEGSATYGLPTVKPLQAFYNGEVAYNLNDFYLFKRYSDHKSLSGTDTYKYYKTMLTGVEGEKKNDNGTLSLVEDARYEANGIDGRTGPYLLSGSDNAGSYVEWRYADGDFIYAAGTIPSAKNERTYTETDNNGNKKEHYYPIWPDDYIYFGQALNYNHVEGLMHRAEPSAINKLGGRLLDTEESNRVFRAPAYFGSSTMSVAHFNPYAVFAQSNNKVEEEYADTVAYRGMTAIDFSGGNGDLAGGYKYGAVAAADGQPAKFYPPLLDDDGITGFTNVDLTRNLLVYTDATNASATTENTVKTKLIDETYQETNETTYRTVAEANNLRQEKTVRGHWVKMTGVAGKPYQAVRDHYLVDKEEFNAPIEYWFDDDHRMWYQRIPDNYVGKKKADGTGFITNGAGWEGVSLPFTAELVTTNTKGEITHFYGTSTTGHEYWLRHFTGIDVEKSTETVKVANLQKPDAVSEPNEYMKKYTNTFLWDHYYSNNTYYDLNSDQYPGTYYKADANGIVKNYEGYPLLACATPYIIGFPGERYYEFDLSGSFEAKTAQATTPTKISAQVITFVSPTGEKIHVSDTEIAAKAEAQTHNGYAFITNFTAKTLESEAYVLNSDDTDVDKRGSSYVKVGSGAQTVPFRPYFLATTNQAREMTRSIIFSDEQTQLEGKDDGHDQRGDEVYSLNIYAKRKKIIVESNLRETTEVRIVNPAGITINTFDIEPGETIETRIYNSGVYIVQTTDGHYNKKLVVR